MDPDMDPDGQSNANEYVVNNTNGLTRVFRDTNAPSDGAFYRARIDVAFRPDAPICI